MLFGGQVVRHVGDGRLRDGAYSQSVRWPKEAVGYPLRVRATVRSGNRTQQRFYAVRVRK